MKKLLPIKEYKYTKKLAIYEPPIQEKILNALKSLRVSLSFDFVRKFLNYILRDPIGLLINLMIAAMVGAIIYGFWWVVNIFSQGGFVETTFVNLTILNSSYVYYGRVGELTKVPLLYVNLTGSEPWSLTEVYQGYPMVKEFYALRSYKPGFYNFLIHFPYPTRIVTPSELKYLPEGSILLIFDDTLPTGTTENLSANPNFLTIFVITDTPPIKEYTGTIPREEYYLVGKRSNLEEYVKAASPIYGIKNGKRESKYRIKLSPIYGNFSTFHITRDGKVVVFNPASFDTYDGNVSVILKDFLTTFKSGYWIREFQKHPSADKEFAKLVTDLLNITSQHHMYPIPTTDEPYHVILLVPGSDLEPSNQYPLFSGEIASENGPVLLPYTVTQREEIFRYQIFPYNPKIKRDTLRMALYNGTWDVIVSQTLGRVTPLVEYNFGVPIKFPHGSYVVKIIGQEPNIYGTYYFEVGNLTVEVIPNARKGMFIFNFRTSTGSPVTVPEVIIEDLSLREGTKIRSSYTSSVIYVPEGFEGKELPSNKYYFNVTVGKEIYTVTAVVPPKTALARLFTTERLILLGVAILIYGGSFLLRRKEEPTYTIDIPEFPPQSTIKVEVSEDEMKELFNYVNNYYKWKYMPLEKDEIVFGLTHKKPELESAVVDDYTLSIFLDELMYRGLIRGHRGYYGLLEWERESGYTLEQLALYRVLRDKAIELAIPSELSLDRSQGYHAKLEMEYSPTYIYLYHPKEFNYIVNNLPKFVGKGDLVILFDNYEQKEKFKQQLYQGTSASSYLKFLINSGVVKLYTIDEFIERLGKFAA